MAAANDGQLRVLMKSGLTNNLCYRTTANFNLRSQTRRAAQTGEFAFCAVEKVTAQLGFAGIIRRLIGGGLGMDYLQLRLEIFREILRPADHGDTGFIQIHTTYNRVNEGLIREWTVLMVHSCPDRTIRVMQHFSGNPAKQKAPEPPISVSRHQDQVA